jgi:sRNA-binding regulator protein Hfq
MKRPGPPHARRSPGPRPPDRRDDQREALARRATEIAHKTGLPLESARLVAAGRADLNELLKKMAFRDEVNALMQRHELNRALATQVALGQADLDYILLSRRIDAHLAANRDRSVLDEAQRSGAEVTLGVHGHRTLRARVKAVERYEVVLLESETGAEERVHKLQLKYAYKPDDHKRVRKSLDYDKTRRDRAIEPVVRPQDRFACSDRRLGAAMDAKHPVSATTLEGECFTGEVAWVARYEFGLRTKGGGEVVIFRHALDDLREERAAG